MSVRALMYGTCAWKGFGFKLTRPGKLMHNTLNRLFVYLGTLHITKISQIIKIQQPMLVPYKSYSHSGMLPICKSCATWHPLFSTF